MGHQGAGCQKKKKHKLIQDICNHGGSLSYWAGIGHFVGKEEKSCTASALSVPKTHRLLWLWLL